jgi:hypothetical protein
MANRKLNPFKVSINAKEDVRKLLVEFESFDAAKAERKIRVKAIKGKHARQLRKALKQCQKNRRCLLPICPVCMRRYRIWYTSRTLRLLAHAGPLLFVTLVDPDDAFSAEELEGFQPKMLIERVRHRLRRAGISLVIGGLDGEFDDGKAKFQPHIHFVCPVSEAGKLMEMARRFYPSSDTVYRGMVIKEVRDSVEDVAKVMTYTCKTFWPRTFHGAGLRVKPKRLRSARHIAWLLWLGRYGLGDLQLFYGVKRQGDEIVITPSNRIQANKKQNLPNDGVVWPDNIRYFGSGGSLKDNIRGNTTNDNAKLQTGPDGHSLPSETFFESMSTAEAATRLEREEILRGLGRAHDLTKKQRRKLVARVRKLSVYGV